MIILQPLYRQADGSRLESDKRLSTLSTGARLLIPKVVDKLAFQAGRSINIFTDRL
ncbi:hypothetical protein OROHE_026065 [Orobanche hederae]